jgi:hypothetical protein
MEYGPPKRRRRSTAGIRTIKCRLALTTEQVDILDAFFLSDLAGGALTFEWVHPRTRVLSTLAFTECKPPVYNDAGGGEKFYADFSLDILP